MLIVEITNNEMKQVENWNKSDGCRALGVMAEIELECNPLSAEGVRSNDYMKWKEETLANQTSHKVADRQRLELTRTDNWLTDWLCPQLWYKNTEAKTLMTWWLRREKTMQTWKAKEK